MSCIARYLSCFNRTMVEPTDSPKLPLPDAKPPRQMAGIVNAVFRNLGEIPGSPAFMLAEATRRLSILPIHQMESPQGSQPLVTLSSSKVSIPSGEPDFFCTNTNRNVRGRNAQSWLLNMSAIQRTREIACEDTQLKALTPSDAAVTSGLSILPIKTTNTSHASNLPVHQAVLSEAADQLVEEPYLVIEPAKVLPVNHSPSPDPESPHHLLVTLSSRVSTPSGEPDFFCTNTNQRGRGQNAQRWKLKLKMSVIQRTSELFSEATQSKTPTSLTPHDILENEVAFEAYKEMFRDEIKQKRDEEKQRDEARNRSTSDGEKYIEPSRSIYTPSPSSGESPTSSTELEQLNEFLTPRSPSPPGYVHTNVPTSDKTAYVLLVNGNQCTR